MIDQGKRFIIIVLDGVGVGYLPDARQYGDYGANTFLHVCERMPSISLPVLQRMGMGNILPLAPVPRASSPMCAFAKMAELSAAKDTCAGHWEMTGVISAKPQPTYPHGFPAEIIAEFEHRIGRKTLCNKPSGGIRIIGELGAEHMRTGSPIVYTSADSVFQIAAHEDVIPIDELYRMCKIARELMNGEHEVGRIIARPFLGNPGSFIRTENRRDYALQPPSNTVLDLLVEAGYDVIGIGKIEDIFGGRGLTKIDHTTNNRDGMKSTNEWLTKDFTGLLFVNLVDFDMLYGHPRNPIGFAHALEEVDAALADTLDLLRPNDILVVTADHGCDPTHHGNDHTREYVPLLIRGNGIENGANLGIRETFADVGSTVADYFQLGGSLPGRSLLRATRTPSPHALAKHDDEEHRP